MPDRPAAGQSIAPMAEKPRFIRQRIIRHDADRNAKRGQPRRAIAWQVKLPAPFTIASCEKSRIGGIAGQYGIAQISSHFVRWLMNTGTNHGDNIAPRGAERFHGKNGFFQYSGHRAAPAGMGASNHAGGVIREKHGRTIAGDDAKRQALTPGHHAIRFRALVFYPGIFRHHHALAMYLRQPTKRLMFKPKRCRGTAAVFADGCRVILAGERTIQRCESAC